MNCKGDLSPNEQSVFGPEDIRPMTAAYEECLRVLKLVDRADPVTQLLAKYIVEVAQKGERDSSRICALTLERLGVEQQRTPQPIASSSWVAALQSHPSARA